MNATDNDNSLFNKLPANILSTIFVLAQNLQLSLLNKNMHYISQQDNTVSNYIHQYALSNTEDDPDYNLKTIFEKYTRINMNETVGALVLRKIKNLDYETALELAFKYRWRNILNKLLKMYLLIDRNTSTIVQKSTLFINEGEYLDIDIAKFFSEESGSQREESDIKISDSLYITPIITKIDASSLLFYEMFPITRESEVQMLLDMCNTKFEFPSEISGSVGRDIRCIDTRFMICCMLVAARECGSLNSLEFLKQILDLQINIDFPFEEIEFIVDPSGVTLDDGLSEFICNYEYTERTDLFNYTVCAYYACVLDRKELMSFLEKNYYSSKHLQILFDVATYHENEGLVKEYFFKVELNPENTERVIEMAYNVDNADFKRFVLNNSDRLGGKLDKHTLIMDISEDDHKLQ
ncbi:hypothetical protein AX774_g6798 [Zancudomyces culisetae]|uniref:Uncharacterized protein n=1 Tax=Zancudomyces culisetae TaxID=1213189 RepID=A0A1R1PFJ3_ZANCU|nr:hypothetical protein AX774_g6798 [Zancudomyces culisetae]|eukprot:OMH79775.1 hypothetical protein AX774_g6798 [Zancudomyces culisetae]